MAKKETEFLTEEEIKTFLSLPDRTTVMGKRDFALFLLMLTIGLRKAEVCSLKVSSLKTYRNQLVIDVLGKGKRHRRLAIRNDVAKAIEDYWKVIGNGHNEDDPLFKTIGKHGPWESKALTPVAIDGIVKKYGKMSLIRKRFHPHMLRHTFATSLLSKGVDLKTVQCLMGHSSIQTTEGYLHTNDEKKYEAIGLLNFLK